MPSQDEVEEFAALLRRLKDRTDRSYAALARRLNMNASTLHRYCAGEAVPLGFAPVERFAALCGATAAERIELHRRWILAVAARQRPRTAPEPAPAAAGALPADGEDAPDEGAPAAEDAPAPATPVPTAVAEPVPSPGAPKTSETPEPSEELLLGSSPEHGGLPRPAARPPWYRRRVPLAAAVVTALIATLGSLSLLPSGHSSATGGDRAAAKAADARHGTPAPTGPAPTHGRPSGSPATHASAAGDRSPDPSASPSTSSAANSTPVAPITWTANSHRWAIGCEHDYVIDKEPAQVPPPPAPQDASPWARSQAAVHGGQTMVDITVQGRTDAAVVLEALRVRVVGRAAPVKGNVYATGQGCGGGLGPHSFTVALDKDRPIAHAVPGYEGEKLVPAMDLPYRVSVTDPEVLTVEARTDGCDCRWYLELDWSSQGRTGTERIDDDGVPFRTSGTAGLPHYWYANGGWTLT
ncbi:helix-turn-helix transcriptional regulator [Streptomyces sp. NPDC002265]|uniref:helix-turn-helix domain-containing protein n=1 Tax=Streptomyces sp. NPDC002265 TaxID=3154415 RepID=UPI003321333F